MEERPRGLRPVWNFALFFVIGCVVAGAVSFVRGGTGTELDPATPERSASAKAEAEACYRRGLAHFQKEHMREAFLEFGKAIELDPTNPEPHAGTAKTYESLDYALRAIESYREAIRLDPKHQVARLSLAKLLCDFGQNEEALALLNDASNTDQENPLVWARLAANEIALGRPQEAIRLLKKYNRRRPNQYWGYIHLGRALKDVEDFSAAEQAYRHGLTLNPYSELGTKWLAELLRETGQQEKAEALFKRFRSLRDLQSKKRKLEQAIARQPKNVQNHVALLVNLASVRQRLGQARQALIPLRNALKLAPDDARLQKLYEDQRQLIRSLPEK